MTDMPALHECPHPHCHRQIPRLMFACNEHWFRLPQDLRRDIALAYSDLHHAMAAGDLDDVRAAKEAFEEVSSAAQPFWSVGT